MFSKQNDQLGSEYPILFQFHISFTF